MSIEHGTGVNAVGSEGHPALYWSVFAGKVQVIDLLVEAGADMDVRARWGTSSAQRLCTSLFFGASSMRLLRS